MPFIRSVEEKGNEYFRLVENYRKDNSIKRRFLIYLGKEPTLSEDKFREIKKNLEVLHNCPRLQEKII